MRGNRHGRQVRDLRHGRSEIPAAWVGWRNATVGSGSRGFPGKIAICNRRVAFWLHFRRYGRWRVFRDGHGVPTAAGAVQGGFGEEELFDSFAAFGAHAKHRFGGGVFEFAASEFGVEALVMVEFAFHPIMGRPEKFPAQSLAFDFPKASDVIGEFAIPVDEGAPAYAKGV